MISCHSVTQELTGNLTPGARAAGNLKPGCTRCYDSVIFMIVFRVPRYEL